MKMTIEFDTENMDDFEKVRMNATFYASDLALALWEVECILRKVTKYGDNESKIELAEEIKSIIYDRVGCVSQYTL